MAKSVDFHILFQNGKARQALERYEEVFVCIDSPVQHEWDMTPGIAPFIECDDDAEIERLFEALTDGGTIHMPLGDYGFGRRFGWVEDQFGVSWLLNIE